MVNKKWLNICCGDVRFESSLIHRAFTTVVAGWSTLTSHGCLSHTGPTGSLFFQVILDWQKMYIQKNTFYTLILIQGGGRGCCWFYHTVSLWDIVWPMFRGHKVTATEQNSLLIPRCKLNWGFFHDRSCVNTRPPALSKHTVISVSVNVSGCLWASGRW